MAATTRSSIELTRSSSSGAAYAGVVSRGIALAIDAALVEGGLLVIAAMLALIGSLVGGVHLGPLGQLLATCAWLVATATYFVVPWSTTGRTPGLCAMDLSVLTERGEPPGVGRSIVRVAGLALCIVPMFIGFLPALFDRRRRGAHDMLAGTTVVHGRWTLGG